MRISSLAKLLLLGVLVWGGLCWSQQARADMADIPRQIINIFNNGDSQFSSALEKHGYKIGYAYDLRNMLLQNANINDGHKHATTKTIKELCIRPEAVKSVRKHLLANLTESGFNHFHPYIMRIQNKYYILEAARQHKDLGLNEEYLSRYAQGQINLSRSVQGYTAARKGNRDIDISKLKTALNSLPIETALTPVALVKHGDKVYAAFLNYELRNITVDEEENTGRFGLGTTNYECYWNKLYLLPLDEIILLSKQPSSAAALPRRHS